MWVPNCCMLGASLLLLLCQIAISQLCKSLITMVDGFHTLFILIHTVLPLPQTTNIKPASSTSPPHVPPCAKSPVKAPPDAQTTIGESVLSDQGNQNASLINTHISHSPTSSPTPTNCSLSYANSRIQTVGRFVSSLLLVSLCISYFMEIISFILDPHPAQHPLLPVVIGAVSLLYKLTAFVLNWAQSGRKAGAELHLEVNHEVLAEEDSRNTQESEEIVQSGDLSAVPSGALVLCNPLTSSIHDSDCKPSQKPLESMCEEQIPSADLNRTQILSVCKSSPCLDPTVSRSYWPVCHLPIIFITEGLFTSLLALINSLVTLQSSGVCSVLVYLDPSLSLLAVITMIATNVPQLYRLGLLLLQASPQHISVTDLTRRILSVPGVQAVHDLHIWQLNERLVVASVHVHCCSGFQVHRCGDLLSGVSKVLKSIGVSCCTVQPEFTSCAGASSNNLGDASPIIHRDDPSPRALPACSLACGKACAGSMCCSPPEEEIQSMRKPPTGETNEEPLALVLENTCL
ncbi:Zinc/cadmium resistance protein [Oryzias melastigma]|nr:zinc/cadmium resistance protein [Oryzias melastigma]KAF6736879.1 Zinc/cadmium resistance protein [Oryzias melastigma]